MTSKIIQAGTGTIGGSFMLTLNLYGCGYVAKQERRATVLEKRST